MSEPCALRVSAAVSTIPAIRFAASRSPAAPVSETASSSFANRMSTRSAISPRKVSRCRSTQNGSERVSATLRPAARGGVRQLHHCRLGRGRIPQITFQIGDSRLGRDGLVDVCRLDLRGGAQHGEHAALGIRRHEHQASPGGGAGGGGRRVETHAGFADIAAESGAGAIVPHPADIAGPGAKRREARRRVGRRAGRTSRRPERPCREALRRGDSPMRVITPFSTPCSASQASSTRTSTSSMAFPTASTSREAVLMATPARGERRRV